MLCELCRSEGAENFHHFVPQTLHSNKWFRKRFSRQDMAAGIDVCKLCHKTIHQVVPDAKELGRHYNTIERLLDHSRLAKYVQWKRSRAGG